jgi:large repetitive protein
VEGVGGSGNGVRFTQLDIRTTILPSDINLLFNISATDRDGDVTATSTLNVFVDATNPVVLDLDGDGAEFLDTSANVAFDYDGDGVAENTAWVGADDGLLAIDRNGDGLVNNGSEIVFGVDGQTDLQGLAAQYDSNGDGVLDANDAAFAQFGVWQDANSNGVTDAGEFRSLTEAGITSIGLVSDGQSYSAANGSVFVHGEAEYTRSDGSTGTVADASFATGPARSAANDDDQRGTTSGTAGLASAMVAAGLVAAIAEANVAAENAPSEATIDDGATNFVPQLVAAEIDNGGQHDAMIDRFAANDDPAASSSQFAAKYASFDAEADVASARVDLGDSGRHESLIADLLAPTEVSHNLFEPAPFSIGAAVDTASEALLIAQRGDGFAKASVQEVISDALAGGVGEGPNVDALLDALAGPSAQPLLGDVLGGSDAIFAPLAAPTHDMLDQLASTHMELSAATGHA